ncbi:MAG: ATP-binding protein [Nanoarchaeota archaeon]
MIETNRIRDVLLRQKENLFAKKSLVTREILKNILEFLNDKRIIIISGMRRVGKSTLLGEIMMQLKSQDKKYCYINFEDEAFLGFEAKDFEKLNEILMEVYGSGDYYFFDEVQNIENFESFIRRIQDDGKKIFLTGSNSSLLSKEFGTKLTGRYKMFELYPFSFKEFLIKKEIPLQEDLRFTTEKKAQIKAHFMNYMELGGVPEYLENKDQNYIQTIYENIIFRDIISRYNIKSQKILRELVNILSSNISSPFTYNSLKKSLNLSNAITVKDYISYLSNSYLFFEVLRFDYSTIRQLSFPRKIYIIDLAFFNIVGVTFKTNFGRIFENLMFIELKRRNKEVFYFQKEKECDFVIKQGNNVSEAIQACYQLTKENKEREISGLLEAMKEFKLKRGLILTYEQEEELTIEGKKILIQPAWKWLIEG